MLELASMYDEVGDKRGVYKSIKKDPKLALKYYYQLVKKNCILGHFCFQKLLENQIAAKINIKKNVLMLKKINSKIKNYSKNPPKNDRLEELSLPRDKIIKLREILNIMTTSKLI